MNAQANLTAAEPVPPAGIENGHGASSLGHYPAARWEFDETVTEVFDDMLARSIPQLEVMRDISFRSAEPFVRPGTDIVDLGCARGDAMAPFIKTFGVQNRFIGIDVSAPMRAACHERFKGLVDCGIVQVRGDDLRKRYPEVRASATLCVLTLQFTPLEHRLRILADAFAHTLPGGVFVLVEKILGADAVIDKLLVDRYYNHKREMGYSQEEIDRKRLSLEGVLVPVTAAWNEDLLRSAGFQHVEPIWRWFNFCGWIAIRN
jgi:tRNA (cmo5U34)-methyltransferase